MLTVKPGRRHQTSLGEKRSCRPPMIRRRSQARYLERISTFPRIGQSIPLTSSNAWQAHRDCSAGQLPGFLDESLGDLLQAIELPVVVKAIGGLLLLAEGGGQMPAPAVRIDLHDEELA